MLRNKVSLVPEGDNRVRGDDVPATFDDGSATKTVDGVGTPHKWLSRNSSIRSEKNAFVEL